MIEADYLWDGRVRWNLWFANPNHAGAFVATVLPWCWVAVAQGWLRGRGVSWRMTTGAILACELMLWWVLCMTYSRGALVGALAAVGVMAVILWRREPERGVGLRNGGGFLAVRIFVGAVMVWAGGFAGRIDPGFVAGDASAGNRIELWLGGLRMLAASPWDGWGAGASGHAYMQFFQPLERDAAYATMVNSWLTMGVERGLLVLGGALLVAGVLLLCGWLWGVRGADAGARLAACATGSLAAFCVASVFSSLWEVGWLWAGVAPALAMLAGCLGCGLCVVWRRGVARDVAVTASVVVAVCLGLVAVGSRLPADVRVRVEEGAVVLTAAEEANREGSLKFLAGTSKNLDFGLRAALRPPGRPFSVHRISLDTIHLGTPSKSGEFLALFSKPVFRGALAFYPDEDVLGRLHGREARRLLLADETIKELRMGTTTVGVDAALLFGREAWRANELSVDCLLVHPLADASGLTEEAWERVRAVVVPELDWSAGAERWRAEAERRGLPLIESPGVGTDIRAVWPEAVGVGVL